MLQYQYDDNRTGTIVQRNTYGFCNSACPGGMLVGPPDVGGACPPGLQTKDRKGVEYCCCGSDDSCWGKCTFGVPPDDCLPRGAEWKFNDNRGYYEAVQGDSSDTTCSGSTSDGTDMVEVYINEDVRAQLSNVIINPSQSKG